MAEQNLTGQVENLGLQQSKSSHFSDGIIKIILIQTIRYFKFTQITPAVLMYSGMILFLIVSAQERISTQITTIPITFIYSVLGLDKSKPHSLETQDFINIYLFISFILFLFFSILRQIFKFNFKFSLKKKLILATVLPIISYFIFSVAILGFKRAEVDYVTGFIGASLFLAVLTILSGIYAVIISSVLNFATGVLSGDESTLENYIKLNNWVKKHQAAKQQLPPV